MLPIESSKQSAIQDLEYELAVASLRAAGIRTEIVVAEPGMVGSLARAQVDRPSDLVYFHLTSRSSFQAATAIVPAFAGTSPRPVLLAGGLFGSNNARELLEETELFAAIIVGEVEATLVAVVQALEADRNWRLEPGIWLCKGGTLRRNPPRALTEDLDTLPRAVTDLMDPHMGTRRQILVGRGCNSHCSYCSLQSYAREAFPLRPRLWRSRSARAIVEEIEYLWRYEGVTYFTLNSFVVLGYDDDGARVVESIARAILARNLSVRFSFVSHPGHLRRNLALIPLLLQAGLESIYLGIDSALERARSLYRLPFNIDDVNATLAALHEHSVTFRTGYIFYDPYLTLDEIGEAISFLRAVRPFYGHLGISYSLLLQQQVINGVLHLESGMPVIDQLRRDHLIVREGNLWQRPLARFRDTRTGRFFHLHRRFNRDVLRVVSPLVFDPKTETRYPGLAFLLLDILDLLRRLLESDSAKDDDDIILFLKAHVFESLSRTMAEAGTTGLLPPEHRELVSCLFGKGGGEAHAKLH